MRPPAMKQVCYRLCNTTDAEERLEDALMWKAMHDTFGASIKLLPTDASPPEDALFFGRSKQVEFNLNQMADPNPKYWLDPAFTSRLSRAFFLEDLKGMEERVEDLFTSGKAVFLKGIKAKHFADRLDTREAYNDWFEGMAYSIMDRGKCVMVQEAVDMSFEHRFMVIDGQVVTHSPVAWHLTPMSLAWTPDVENMHFPSPGSKSGIVDHKLKDRMIAYAQSMADEASYDHICIDLAVLGSDPEGPIEPIEWNPMLPGAVGLYACDPKLIAEAASQALNLDALPVVDLE